MRKRAPGITLVVLLFAACAMQEGSPASFLVRDSAGITIVENAVPEHEPIVFPAERLPVLSFGRTEHEAIGSVASAVRLSSGNIVFIDFQARSLRMFVPGEGVRDIARSGYGPGEVVFPVNLQRLAGDSIQIYDRRQGRVSVFSPGGDLAYEISLLHGEGRRPVNVARMQDSMLVGQLQLLDERIALRGKPDANIGRTPQMVVAYGLDGVVRDTAIVLDTGPMDVRYGTSSLMPAYGYNFPFAVTASGTFVHGPGDHASYDEIGPDGTLLRSHRIARAREAIDIDSLHAILATDRPIGPAPPRPLDHPNLAPEFLPDSQPAYKHLRVFADDRVWLGSADPFLMPSQRWDVMSSDGRWLGTVQLPEKTMLLDVADGYILLRRSDDLDVQYIEVYEAADLFGGSAS